ncbi:hypothetical protein BGZ95_009830 [Linnemannia exigua]|uniref:Uncharacterized protein n=1 Tax=Linnemannia exigua TaxID=604196 RepID=A0AAD4DKN5_9FUNG|nr:hypothetical protein BGZ95_009830 [Linnemannia exigua]
MAREHQRAINKAAEMLVFALIDSDSDFEDFALANYAYVSSTSYVDRPMGRLYPSFKNRFKKGPDILIGITGTL